MRSEEHITPRSGGNPCRPAQPPACGHARASRRRGCGPQSGRECATQHEARHQSMERYAFFSSSAPQAETASSCGPCASHAARPLHPWRLRCRSGLLGCSSLLTILVLLAARALRGCFIGIGCIVSGRCGRGGAKGRTGEEASSTRGSGSRSTWQRWKPSVIRETTQAPRTCTGQHVRGYTRGSQRHRARDRSVAASARAQACL